MYKYVVKIKINTSGATQNVTIHADNHSAAKSLAEMQYGKDNVLFVSSGSR